jgi:hypothetical protein
MGWENWRGPELMASVSGGLREAVRKTCHVVLEAADQEVPHDEGTLMRSGIVLMAPDGSPEGCISFGGGEGTGHPVIPYAVRWHENNANFQKGRKRFYLKDPMNRLCASTLQKAIADELGRRLK